VVEPQIRSVTAEEWPAAARLVGRAMWEEPLAFVMSGEDRLTRFAGMQDLFLGADLVERGRPVVGAFARGHIVAVAAATPPADCPYCATVPAEPPTHGWDVAFRPVHEKLHVAHRDLPPHWRIAPVASEPGLQGIGLGGLVVRAIVEEAVRREPGLMSLECAPHVVRFYERLGFTTLADVSEGAIELVAMVGDPAAS
jgi:GNAT superfamily N-acetyltransferase